MVLPALRESCLFGGGSGKGVGMNKKCNFSAMGSSIELKLGGNFGLVSHISVHVLVSRFNCFSYCKQTNKQKTAEIVKNTVLENLSFLRRSKSD
jgi:hypothetical protein